MSHSNLAKALNSKLTSAEVNKLLSSDGSGDFTIDGGNKLISNVEGDLTGNADTSTTSPAGALTGDTLKSTVVNSSLQNLGTQDEDLNLGGYELLKAKTILDQQIAPYYNFNGSSGNILVTDDASFAELFKNGGTYICKFNAFTAGQGAAGAFFNKSTTNAVILKFISGVWRFYVDFSVSPGDWQSTGTNIPLNKDSIVVLSYNGSSPDNQPALYVDGEQVVLVEQGAGPSGVIRSDSGANLHIGNGNAGGVTFDGNIYETIFLNRELTAAEAISWSSNPQKALDCKDKGGSNTNQLTGNDSTFSGAGNWLNDGLTTFDVNSTVAGKAYMLGSGGQDYIYILGVLEVGCIYRISIKARLNTGASTEIYIGNTLRPAPQTDSFAFTPTGIEATYTGTIIASTVNIGIGKDSVAGGFSGVAFEIDDVVITKLGATLVLKGENATDSTWYDSSGNGNDGAVTTATRHNKQQALEIGDSALVVRGDTGYVGIGTASPDSPLHILSSASSTALRLENSGGVISKWLIQSDGGITAQANLAFYSITASAYRMIIDGSGNVGIGTASPGYKLDVLADAPGDYAMKIFNTSSTGRGLFITTDGSSTEQILRCYSDIDGTPIECLNVLNNGNVGIGTASPAKPLDVVGDIKLSGDIIIADGKGIDFSAYTDGSVAGTTTSQLLDDYEEGTWTPSIGGDATYTAQVGAYTKIGNRVDIWFNLTINAIGTGSQTIMSGLPYSSGSNGPYSGSLSYFTGGGFSTYWLGCYIGSSTATVLFTGQNGLDTNSENAVSVFASGAQIIGYISYNI